MALGVILPLVIPREGVERVHAEAEELSNMLSAVIPREGVESFLIVPVPVD